MTTDNDYQHGFDYLRLLALSLVVWQHASSLAGGESISNIATINLGQLGVAIFFGISGALAASSSRAPVAWLQHRLARIYPSFWVVTCVCVGVMWISGYKSLTLLQVVSQLVGVGFFTNQGSLVNTPTWFVSVLLLGYLLLFVARLTGHDFIALGAIIGGVCFWMNSTSSPWPQYHLVAFLLSSTFTMATKREHRPIAYLLVSLTLFMFGIVLDYALYGAIAFLLMTISSRIRARNPIASLLTKYSYEFYLVHGPLLYAAARLMPGSVLFCLVAGGVCACACSVVLQRTVNWAFAGWLRPLPEKSPTESQLTRSDSLRVPTP